ncbi:MAG: hypothetical protein ACJZ9F_03780 [Rhodospirillaceae bacterium]
MPHIVCFAPYTDWSIHSARQVTILHALRQRGASVTYVTCDGVFSDCDLFQKATGAAEERQPNSCLVCQASVAARLAAWDMPYRWLGTWLNTQDRYDAGHWLSQLSPQDYVTARYRQWNIGAWVKSSVRTHLRCNNFDVMAGKVADTYASYLYSGVLAALGLSRLFDDEKPDIQMLFNGRMAPTRIALEIAKQKGIRTIVEERSSVSGRLLLFEDVNCLDIKHVDYLWETWKDQPLTVDEIFEIDGVLEDRRNGGQGEVSVFSNGRQAKQEVCQKLGLDTSRPVWVLFTSSVDEIADKENIISVFPNQNDWVEASLSYAAAHPDLQLVVRVHPNVGSDRSLGANMEDIEYFRSLESQIPSNVCIVQPGDNTSSYTLAELCEVALVWYSTIGIEAAVLGRRVVQAGGFLLEGREFVSTPESPDAYAQLLDTMNDTIGSEKCSDTTIYAWRFAYLWFLRRTFKLPQVAQSEWYAGEPIWQTVEDLKPNKEPNLDHLCNVFLGDTDLLPFPSNVENRKASTEREAIRTRISEFRK